MLEKRFQNFCIVAFCGVWVVQGAAQMSNNHGNKVKADDGMRSLGKIGEICESNEECVGNPGVSSTCTKSKVCSCMTGYAPSITFDDCLQLQNELGGQCKESQQCTLGAPGPLSECTEDEICNCKTEAVSEGNGDVCFLKATLIGQTCEVDSQCTSNLGLSHCLNNKSCECWSNAVPNRNETRCQLNKKLGDECGAKEECDHIRFAGCSAEKKCECDEGYGRNPNENNTNSCMKWATVIGDVCDEDKSQCQDLVNATCMADNDGYFRCNCDSTQVESEDQITCLPKVMNLNESCIESVQCTVSHSVCLNSTDDGNHRCCCVSNYVEGVAIPNQCLSIGGMGSLCTEDVQCSRIGSPSGTVPCYNGHCGCNYISQVIGADWKSCLPKRMNLNETCTLGTQCWVYNSSCGYNFADGIKRCGCKGTHVEGKEIPNRCLPRRDATWFPCEEDIQCSPIGNPPGTVPCYGGFCHCELPHQFFNEHCVIPLSLNQSCNSTDQCIAGGNNMAWCAGKNGDSDPGNKWCQCKGENTTIVNGMCYSLKRIGDICTSDKECTVTIVGSVSCLYVDEDEAVNGTLLQHCTCTEDTIADEEGLMCGYGDKSKSSRLDSHMNIRICSILMAFLLHSQSY